MGLFQTLVHSSWLNRPIVYGAACPSYIYLEKLDPIQKQTLRLGAFLTLHIMSALMYMEAHEFPLDLHTEIPAIHYALKDKGNSKNPAHGCLFMLVFSPSIQLFRMQLIRCLLSSCIADSYRHLCIPLVMLEPTCSISTLWSLKQLEINLIARSWKKARMDPHAVAFKSHDFPEWYPDHKLGCFLWQHINIARLSSQCCVYSTDFQIQHHLLRMASAVIMAEVVAIHYIFWLSDC